MNIRIGIDIGKDSMKIISILDDLKEIQAMEIIPININVEDNYAEFIKEVKSNVNKFCKTHGIKKATLDITIPLSENDSFYKLINLPPLKKKLLEKSIKYEIEDSNEIDLNDYYHKWSVTGVNSSKELQTISVLGVNKNYINQIANLGTLKNKINHLEVGFNSIGRFSYGNKIAIDFGQTQTRIYTFKEDNPFLYKTISIAGKDIDNEIEKILNKKLTKDDLLEIKKNINLLQTEFGNSQEKILHDAVNKKIDELIEEIVRYIRGIEVQYDLYIEIVNFFGGLILMKGFRDKLEDALMLTLDPLNTDYIKDSMSVSEKSLFFNVLSVLSHKSVPYHSDLYFGKYVKKQMDYSAIFITTICACLLMQYSAIDINRRYDEKIAEIQRLADHQNTIVTELQSKIGFSDQIIQTNQSYINQIYSMKDNKALLSKMLYILSEKTPKSVSLYDIYLRDGQLQMEGYSEDYSSIGFLSKSLDDYGEFSIESISEVEEEVYSENGTKMTKKFNASLTFDNRNVFLTQSQIEKHQQEASKEDELIKQINENLNKIYEINSSWSKKFEKNNLNPPINNNYNDQFTQHPDKYPEYPDQYPEYPEENNYEDSYDEYINNPIDRKRGEKRWLKTKRVSIIWI